MLLNSYTINFFRNLITKELKGSKLCRSFMDENGKITLVIYRVKQINKNTLNRVYRLDGRSLRYMKRYTIIENTLPSWRMYTINKDSQIPSTKVDPPA